MKPDPAEALKRTIAALQPNIVPDMPEDEQEAAQAPRILIKTGYDERYRQPWKRPTDHAWRNTFVQILAAATGGGISILAGNRGTGKTQLSAEVVRERFAATARYTTAMGLFLRLRASYRDGKGESESDIVRELSAAPLLILDEIQERGESEWEDRILTHLIDLRYSAVKPTLLIANLKPAELPNHLGPSIVDRTRESGGIIEIIGKSHRTPTTNKTES